MALVDAWACTAVIASGRVTADGRPFIFKNRDASDGTNNSLLALHGAKYDYVGVVNYSSSSSPASIWYGHNEAGFAILNTLSYYFNSPTSKANTSAGALMKKALGQFSLASELQFNPIEEVDFPPAPKGYIPKQPEIHYTPGYNPFGSTSSHKGFSSGSATPKAAPIDPKWTSFFDIKASADKSPAVPTDGQTSIKNDVLLPLDEHPSPISQPTPCMQLNKSHIVSVLPSGLLVVDQQAAHERILFERLSQRKTPAHPQQLLFPVNCQFTPADADIFNELIPDLKEYGFEIGSIGQTTFVITATPTDVKESELQSFFDQILLDYKSSMLQKFNNRTQCLCRSLAHQMAVKCGTVLQQTEMQQLIADLFCCQTPTVSPSGKKTMVILSPEQLLN